MHARPATDPAFASRHLSFLSDPNLSPREAAAQTFHRMAATLTRGGLLPFQEKIYGPARQRDAILKIRAKALARAGLDANSPCSYTTGRVDDDLGFGGVQLWAIETGADSDCSVRSVAGGRLLEADGLRMLALAELRGSEADGSLPTDPAVQAERMFRDADRALAAQGFSFGDVSRTWIYCRHLLDWYEELNRVRLTFFAERGITGDARGAGGAPFPASTGIQGTGRGEECVMDLCAIQSDGDAAVAVTPIAATSRQHRAFDYGSSFSRGMTIDRAGERTILVSGTASIDTAGRSLHAGQREPQIIETLLNIEALLVDQGGSLRDLRTATLFCKDRETLDVYRQLQRQGRIAELPTIPVLADVCRDDLLVEIEAVAVLPAPR